MNRLRTVFAVVTVGWAILLPDAAFSQVDPSYLAEDSPDVVFSQAVLGQAADLGFEPVRIYEFVRNEFVYQPYFGLMKGPDGTLSSRAGNDYDLAALLVSLLRCTEDANGNGLLDPGEDLDEDGQLDRGTPARFARGRILMSEQQGMAWLGKTDRYDLDNHLWIREPADWPGGILGKKAYFQYSAGLYVTHVWVEVLVPLATYRGASLVPVDCDTSQCSWLALDPSFKQSSWQGTYLNYPFDKQGYYAATSPGLPFDYHYSDVRGQLATSHPGTSLADLPLKGVIDRHEAGVLPTALPYEIASPAVRAHNIAGIQDPAEPYRGRWRVEVCQSEDIVGTGIAGDPRRCGGTEMVSYEAYSAAISGERLTLTYVPDGSSNPSKPRLYLGGSLVQHWAPDTGKLTDSQPDRLLIRYLEPQGLDFFFPTTQYSVGGNAGTWLVALNAVEPTDGDVTTKAQALVDALEGPYAPDPAPGQDPVGYDNVTVNGTLLTEYPEATDALIGSYLDLVATRYYQLGRAAFRDAVALHHRLGYHFPWTGVVESAPAVRFFAETPYSLLPDQVLYIDMSLFSAATGRGSSSIDSGVPPWFWLLGHQLSALESSVWEEVAGVEAISTVKGLRVRHDQGVPVLEVSRDSVDSILGNCPYPSGYQPGGPTSAYTCSDVTEDEYCKLRQELAPYSALESTITVSNPNFQDI
ncbi:MAG: hypothetical protein P8Q97_07780, partial [Myxococcota bacterium]|nr:hypothetical protein [Myxococcota bacterium]